MQMTGDRVKNFVVNLRSLANIIEYHTDEDLSILLNGDGSAAYTDASDIAEFETFVWNEFMRFVLRDLRGLKEYLAREKISKKKMNDLSVILNRPTAGIITLQQNLKSCIEIYGQHARGNLGNTASPFDVPRLQVEQPRQQTLREAILSCVQVVNKGKLDHKMGQPSFTADGASNINMPTYESPCFGANGSDKNQETVQNKTGPLAMQSFGNEVFNMNLTPAECNYALPKTKLKLWHY